jgi:tripartite-type tricarboxylate transporter receptor subunit TctC
MHRLPSCGTRAALHASLAFALSFVAAHPARADAVEDFYKGKTISLAIAHSAGGGYDLYGRLLARFWRKHIPGHPIIVPQQMTGAGGLRVVNYLYSAAPKDGTFIGTFSRSLPTLPLFTTPSPTFDGTKLTWIGSMANDTSVCITGGQSAIKTWQDMLTKPVIMGGQGSGSDSDIYARLYRNVFGAKIKLVSGYPGTNDITLAMDRGEVDGICGLSWGTIKIAHAQRIRERSINMLVQAGLAKDPELPDLPLATDLISDPEKKKVLYLHMAPQGMGRPFAAPPGIPADRKAALISAFNATMKDPQFLETAAKEGMDISPITGGEIDELLKQLYAMPPDIIAQAAKAIAD